MPISYLKGDATSPCKTGGVRLIIHICNDCGGWGRGFVLALSRKCKEPERAYRAWHAKADNFALGMIQLVELPDGIIVVNMIAQHGYSRPGRPAIRYSALYMCLSQVAKKAKELGASIHCPRLGIGLAGGNWKIIERILADTTDGLEVFVYDLPKT